MEFINAANLSMNAPLENEEGKWPFRRSFSAQYFMKDIQYFDKSGSYGINH